MPMPTRLKKLLRDITPPLLWRATRILVLGKQVPAHAWQYAPNGFAKGTPARGWNLSRVAQAEASRFGAFKASIAAPAPVGGAHETEAPGAQHTWAHGLAMCWAYVLGRAANGHKALSILDWGGGLGHSYLLARSLWPDLTLSYRIQETPEMAKAGQALLPEVEFQSDEVAVFAEHYDLVVASGAMHYAQDWRALLQKLARASRNWLYITRLPTLTQAATYVFMQRVPGLGYDTEYLGWCINRQEFLRYAASLGLRLDREFLVDEIAPAVDAPEIGQYRGFLFQQGSAR
jgi:putative methyltransferase (TIGR04325 family)